MTDGTLGAANHTCPEWLGYLNRDGSPVWSAKANGWKGFFHLPRILYRAYQLLDQGIHTLTDLKEPTQ